MSKVAFNPVAPDLQLLTTADDLYTDLDVRYLRRANDLSDLNNAGTARTNLGLVAGGAGDIWVEKAGDTMTGALTNERNALGANSVDAVILQNTKAATALARVQVPPRIHGIGHAWQSFGGTADQQVDFLLQCTPISNTDRTLSSARWDFLYQIAGGGYNTGITILDNRLGIGTTNPISNFEVWGASPSFRLQSTGTGQRSATFTVNDGAQTVGFFSGAVSGGGYKIGFGCGAFQFVLSPTGDLRVGDSFDPTNAFEVADKTFTGTYVFAVDAGSLITTVKQGDFVVTTGNTTISAGNLSVVLGRAAVGADVAGIGVDIAFGVYSNTGGFLPPVMSARDRDAWTPPSVNFPMIINSDIGKIQFYTGAGIDSGWETVTSA